VQITDQQFIDAMSQAVKDKGPSHSAPGSYWNASKGEAYCIVGYALSLIDKSLCPTNNSHMANTLLPMLGCSRRVGDAAYAAQGLNDRNVGWEQVHDAFLYGMQVWREDMPLPVLFNMVQDHWRGRMLESLTKATKKASVAFNEVTATAKVASGGITVASGSLCGDAYCSCNTFTWSSSSKMFATLTADFSTAGMTKEPALISA
jgi:hypothetical protein